MRHFANAVVVHNREAALDIQVVDDVNSGIHRPSRALILISAPLTMTNLYILRDVTMVVHHSFAPETNRPMVVVVVHLDTYLVAVVHDRMAVIRLANDVEAAVVDHEYHNAVVVALHNILLVDRVGVGNFVEYLLHNVVLVAGVVVDIAVIDPLVVEV